MRLRLVQVKNWWICQWIQFDMKSEQISSETFILSRNSSLECRNYKEDISSLYPQPSGSADLQGYVLPPQSLPARPHLSNRVTDIGVVAAYAMSKAGLLSLHESLTAELGLSSPVKTTLVVAGQMYTPLFYGVRTPSTFIAPIVEPLDVARQVVSAIENRVGGEIYAPWYVGYM